MPALTRRNRHRWSSALVVVALGVTAGCGNLLNPRQQARDNAERIVRADARHAQEDFSRILQEAAGDDDGPAKAADQARDEMASRGQLIAVALDNYSTVRVQLAFYAQGEADSGLRHESETVRLCVALQGTPVRAAAAELVDAPCPSGLLPSGRHLDDADETVKLTD